MSFNEQLCFMFCQVFTTLTLLKARKQNQINSFIQFIYLRHTSHKSYIQCIQIINATMTVYILKKKSTVYEESNGGRKRKVIEKVPRGIQGEKSSKDMTNSKLLFK